MGQADTTDLRHIVDNLLSEIKQMADKVELETPVTVPTIEGVRINCLGHIIVDNHLPVEKRIVPLSTCNTATALDLPVATKVGIPLVLTAIEPRRSWRDKCDAKGTAYISNPFLEVLHSTQASSMGSMVAVHKDKKRLLVAHVLALIDYLTGLGSEADRQQNASPEGFAKYYETWVMKGGALGFGADAYDAHLGPYDV